MSFNIITNNKHHIPIFSKFSAIFWLFLVKKHAWIHNSILVSCRFLCANNVYLYRYFPLHNVLEHKIQFFCAFYLIQFRFNVDELQLVLWKSVFICTCTILHNISPWIAYHHVPWNFTFFLHFISSELDLIW